MNLKFFRLLKEFDDLPLGTREKQKSFVREGEGIDLQTAIALYRNRRRLYGGILSDLFPLTRILCQYGFQKTIWSNVKYKLNSPSKDAGTLADNLSDASFIFDINNLEPAITLIEAGKFLTVSDKLLYEAREWSLKERITLAKKIHLMILSFGSQLFLSTDDQKYFIDTAKRFFDTIEFDFCERELAEVEKSFLASDWVSLSGWFDLLKAAHLKYSIIPFPIDDHKEKIDEVASDFIKNKRWVGFKPEDMKVSDFCHFLSLVDEEKYGYLVTC